MDYKGIIEEILNVYKLNASDLANKIDVQRSSISHILSGRNKPSLDMMIKVKESFPELRWDYILLGEKPMTITEKKHIEEAKEEQQGDLFQPISQPSPTQSSQISRTDETSEIKMKESEQRKLQKIVWFYSDNSFEVYNNED